jgi:ABC-type nickel/cobalt efflux system permease component RcnA
MQNVRNNHTMGLSSVLFLGAAFGVLHALEADHLAAVATLAARSRSVLGTLRLGIAWGIGHSMTLLAFGGAVLLLGAVISDRTAHWLEAAVGVMLVALGADLLRRLAADLGRAAAHPDPAQPMRESRVPLRAVAVGMMHGMAGSAALVLLALEKMGSPLLGAGYILLFGLGSMTGMALLSAAISLPLRATAARLAAMHRGAQGIIAAISIGLGLQVLYNNLA